ncbi:MAG: AAA family ATPase [Verrucomicrobia bacterium]|nr:MAG: AAA family ATPase [Verrucomicrobiota bacterium]PYK51539.1 MAG: AAA family ATPase [Verrucomicrobiota bacterium]
MLPRRSSVFFSTAAKQDTNYICFAGSSFYANSKTNGKVNTNRESGPIKSDVEARVKVRVRNQKPCPHIAFAKAIAHADHLGVTDHVDTFTKQICEVIVGKTQAVKLAVACLLARGHLLIEDIPGVGKTMLSQALARSLALAFQRIQFTSDLLPADILGNSIFDRSEQRFVFHRGPLFSQVVLVDEVNRATAKTQSALLEAMEEHHISVDGVTYELPEPFFVIATQNPQHAVGTFPLPESQLDRFLMRIELGVPDRASERAMLLGMDRHEMLKELKPVMSPRALIEIQDKVRKIYASPALLDYLQDLLDASRQRHSTGLSPRAGLALLHASQAWALMHGREMVLPEDIQAAGIAVMAHRLGHDIEQPGHSGRTLADNLLHSVPVP